jgi:DNA helicase-2/ATP-dependent DNA helicase PcrA
MQAEDLQRLLDSLNDTQRAAVTPERGVLLVHAGAGSGKTRVITTRIINLLAAHDVLPSAILALTFTNKAAREMRERVVAQLGPQSPVPFIGTFHAFCVRLLKQNRYLFGGDDFTILDQDDREKLIKTIIAASGTSKQITPSAASHAISAIKNDGLSARGDLIGNLLLRDIYMRYEQEKKNAHCLDFDDLLTEGLALFKNPEFKKHFQQGVRHVLVDEYQDTNVVQHQLLRGFACDEQGSFILDSLCVVGDEDQSIYSWRGATVANILNFTKDFPGAQRVTIDQNYRSRQPILEAANAVIAHNAARNQKQLWSEKKGTDRVRVLCTPSDRHEGDVVTLFVQKMRAKLPQATCAVLYRSHYQSRALEEALVRNSIPYKIVGGVQFYERQEIKDMLAYLRLAVNPYDRISFMRVCNVPSRGLGDKFEEQFLTLWSQQPLLTFDAVANMLIDEQAIPPLKRDRLREFCHICRDIGLCQTPIDAFDCMIEKTRYLEHLRSSCEKAEASDRIDNLAELRNAMGAMQERGIGTVREFLEEIALLNEHIAATADRPDAVFLMTLHAAKGLEFDAVMLAGVEEGIFPSMRSIENPETLEEERRLLYVGITRAREYLLISHTQRRFTFGRVTEQAPSRFLAEIPKGIAKRDDLAVGRGVYLSSYFDDWLGGGGDYRPAARAQTSAWDTPAFAADSRVAEGLTKNPESPKSCSWDAPAFGLSPDRVEAARVIPDAGPTWQKYQTVHHKAYGIGVIQDIERKTPQKVYLTIRFGAGVKKIDAKFVTV